MNEERIEPTNTKGAKDQAISSVMTPTLVWHSKQNVQLGVSHTLQHLLPSIFLLHRRVEHECICCTRRQRTLVELEFVKKLILLTELFFQIVNLSMNVTHVVV